MYELAYQFFDGDRTGGPVDVTKSGTGTWDLGREDSGKRGLGNAGMWDGETLGRGTSRTRYARSLGLRDTGTLGDSRTWDVWTRGRDKQTKPTLLILH